MFRLQPNLSLVAIIVVGVSFFAWRRSVRTGVAIEWILVLVSSLAAFLGVFLVSLLFVMLGSTSRSGVIGRHTFTIEDAGLREQTAANDTLSYWSAIRRIEKTRAAINVQISPWLFYVMPRRSFGSDEAFDAFFDALVSQHRAKTAPG